jgi:catechol 2,3-dioxygenase-like lactoylglutathione lyase family enzyme
MKLASARIVTRDVAALTRFYREVTGVAPVESKDYVEFRTACGTLAICCHRSMEANGAAGATMPATNLSVVLDFQVDDVDRERTRLAAAGVKFVLQPTDQPWGNRSMLFRDPDGNLINFFAPLRVDR